jgi:hypothetical protein
LTAALGLEILRSSHKRWAKIASVMSGCVVTTASSRLARCNDLAAEASLRPNRRAAERQLSAPLFTTSITRSRKS